MKSTLLLTAALACAVATAAPTARQLHLRGTTLNVAADGTFDLLDGETVRLRAGRLISFSPDWHSAGQTVDGPPAAAAGNAPLVIRGRLGDAAAPHWTFTETIVPDGDAVRFVYELTASADMKVNEVSWMADLPLAVYRGKRLVMLPDRELLFPVQQPQSRHFVSTAAVAYVFAAGEPWQVRLDLDLPRLCNVQDTREWKGDVYQPFIKIIEGARAVKAGERFSLSFTLSAADPQRVGSLQPDLTMDKPLRLGEPQLVPARVSAGALVTLQIDLSGRWRTPFWAEEVALDAEITGAGRTWRVPGFYTRGYKRSLVSGRELLQPEGEPTWQVRFLPPAPGEYQVTLTARDSSGTVSCKTSFTAQPGPPPAYVRVSKTDPHYFELTDGQPYFANGLNVCWYRHGQGTADYDDWFSKLGAAGGNYARVWMPEWAFGFEWGKPGAYRLERAWQFDRVLELARQQGIRIKLCLEFFRNLDGGNPYAKANGGPCDKMAEVFTNPDAQRMFRNRLRYAVARWGWSPNLMAWELWNEIDCVQGYKAAEVQAWERDMCRYLRQTDAFGHLTVSSLGSFVYEPELWRAPEMDFAQMHGYWHPKWRSTEFGRDMAQMMADHVAMVRKFDKPCFFAEFGLVNETWGPSPRMADDPDGLNLHNGMWGAMMAGAAGTGHLWWWDNYVAPQNLWYHFRGVASFIDGVRWNTEGFQPVALDSSPDLRAVALVGKTQTLVWAQNRAHTWWNVAEKHPVPPVAEATVKLPAVRGVVRVETWDTWTGKRLAVEDMKAGDDGLTLRLGTVARDVAVKIERR